MNDLKEYLRQFLGFILIGLFSVWTFSWSTHTLVWFVFIVLSMVLLTIGTLINTIKKAYRELAPFV